MLRAAAIQVPAVSTKRAEAAFKDFKLGKPHSQVTVANRVTAKTPAGVHAAHRKVIAKNLDAMAAFDAAGSNRAMTIALPPAVLKTQLPSFEHRKGEVDLSEVLAVLGKNMRGTEFYAKGEPTLHRLALQAQVQELVEAAKQQTVAKARKVKK